MRSAHAGRAPHPACFLPCCRPPLLRSRPAARLPRRLPHLLPSVTAALPAFPARLPRHLPAPLLFSYHRRAHAWGVWYYMYC